MAQEKGIIVKRSGKLAWVKTNRTSACEHCSEKESCEILDNSASMEVEVENSINANIGDLVVISVKNSSLLKLSFLLYVFPIIAMMIGAYLGNDLNLFSLGASVSSVLMSIFFFLSSFFLIRLRGKSMAKKSEYKPKIIRKCTI